MLDPKRKEELLKQASFLKAIKRFGSKFSRGAMGAAKEAPSTGEWLKKMLLASAAIGGTGLVLGGAAAGAGEGVKAIVDPIRKKVGRKRMYRENPFLQHEDKKTVEKYYDTLYRFSPSMAMDPLVSGSFMKKQLEFKDVGIQPTDLQTITNVQKAVSQSRGDSIITKAFGGADPSGSLAMPMAESIGGNRAPGAPKMVLPLSSL